MWSWKFYSPEIAPIWARPAMKSLSDLGGEFWEYFAGIQTAVWLCERQCCPNQIFFFFIFSFSTLFVLPSCTTSMIMLPLESLFSRFESFRYSIVLPFGRSLDYFYSIHAFVWLLGIPFSYFAIRITLASYKQLTHHRTKHGCTTFISIISSCQPLPPFFLFKACRFFMDEKKAIVCARIAC